MLGICSHHMLFLYNTPETFFPHDSCYLILGDIISHPFHLQVDLGASISPFSIEKDIPNYSGKSGLLHLSLGRFMVQPSVICTPANF